VDEYGCVMRRKISALNKQVMERNGMGRIQVEVLLLSI